MKKILILVLVAGAGLLTSCDTKSCRCYEYVNGRWTGPSTTITLAGTACGDLNSGTTYCNEEDDPIIDPDDIAIGKK